MNKRLYTNKYAYYFISVLILISLIMTFHFNNVEAAERTPNDDFTVNHKLTKNRPNETTIGERINTTNKYKANCFDKNSNIKSKEEIQSNKNNLLKHKNIISKEPDKTIRTPFNHKRPLNQRAQPASKLEKSKKIQIVPSTVKDKKVLKQPNVLANATRANKNQTKVSTKSIKAKKISSTTNKKKTVQFLSATTKNKPSKTQIKKAKASKSVKVKITPKPSKKKQKKNNYYNQAPKAWSSKIPGSDNVRDFGQTTSASGINDALKIMKASGNKGVTLEHTNAKVANIATIFNWNPTAKALTYGTGTAIGKHTIITANHVINNQQAHKPMTPSAKENLRINLLQEGSKAVCSLKVTGVKMLQHGDVALLYTDEDISKYMKIRKIAPEHAITNIKSNTPIHLYHYGLPTGQFKNDPMGTMYHSKGKYSLMARNVNPMGYYQMMAEPGSSGGAILNSKNEILGIHAFRIDSGDYKKYHLNTMAELRGNLRKEIIKNIK